MLSMHSWGVICVGIEHDVTLDTISRVRHRLHAFLQRSENVILDLRHIKVDSAGLGTILALQRRLELQQRTLFVVSDNPQLLALLEVTGTRGALQLCSSVDEAMVLARGPHQERALA